MKSQYYVRIQTDSEIIMLIKVTRRIRCNPLKPTILTHKNIHSLDKSSIQLGVMSLKSTIVIQAKVKM